MILKAYLKSKCIKEFEGSVVYAGEKAIDAVGKKGAVALIREPRDMGPYGVLVNEALPNVKLGERVKLEGNRLTFDEHFVDLSTAHVWSSSDIALSKFKVELFELMIKELKELSGLHYLTLLSPELLDDKVYSKIGRALMMTPPDLDDIAGLGYGMTPSGDDAIVGLLLATRGKLQIWPENLEKITSRTSALSGLIIKCAAVGEAPWRLASLISSLNSGSKDEIKHAVGELSKAGHSSGLDMLVGFLAGYRSMLRTSSP